MTFVITPHDVFVAICAAIVVVFFGVMSARADRESASNKKEDDRG